MKTLRIVGGAALLLCSGLSHALSIHNAQRQVPWPEGRIPFLITERASNTAALEQNLRNAITEWNAAGAQQTLFRFFEITPAQVAQYPEHLDIRLRRDNSLTECGAGVSTAKGNVAGVGNASGFPGSDIRTTMTLFAEGCGERTPAHELGHVLGFLHEHQRQDANLILNLCNHARAGAGTTNDECKNLYVNGWAASTRASSLNLYISDYDPFSVMHYSLQNNLKPALAGPIDPATGNYTTIDFNRDPVVENNLDELSDRLNLTPAQIYDRMQNPVSLLSDLDKSAARALYARDSTDVQVNLVTTCFAKSKPVGDCLNVGDFIVTMTINNFGAWPATDVPVTLSLHNNMQLNTLQLDTDENCGINIGTSTLECELASVAPNADIQIVLSGKVSDPGKSTKLNATVTPPETQNPLLANSEQYAKSVSFGGSLGWMSALMLLGFGFARRLQRRVQI